MLQTAAASLRKDLTLEGYVSEDIPLEVTIIASLKKDKKHISTCILLLILDQMQFQVMGDVLRIRQILTNLIRLGFCTLWFFCKQLPYLQEH